MLSEIYAAMMRVNDESKIAKFIAKLKIASFLMFKVSPTPAQLVRIYVL
jgi:hypothetical protein